MKTLAWLATLVALISFILILIGILAVRATWDQNKPSESAFIWLYIGTTGVFVSAMMMAISAETRPNLCQLPYSGKYVEVV